MLRALVAVACLIAVAVPATAGPRKPAYSWTGWYVGGNLGYGWSDDATIDPNATGTTTGLFASEAPFIVASQLATLDPLNTQPDGVLGGVQTGYNFQSGGVVFGIEVDYAWANISDSSSRTVHSEFNIPNEPGFGVTTNMTVQEKLESLATLRARLGVTPVEDLLLYVTAGAALGRTSSAIDVSMIETGPTPCISFTPSSGSSSSNRLGWTAGGGGEWAFAPNVSAKVEYLHYDLGSSHFGANQISDISCPGSNPASTTFASVGLAPSAEFKGDLVRAGLNFKLDGP
jgi:outer membrane immunogenic protein